MMILKSNNPFFSWVISKNPETQRTKNEPFKKSLRRGSILGWFNSTNDEFRMFFKDAEESCSFALNGEFEYLDRTRYSSPYLPIAAINELLRSASQEANEKDTEGFENSFQCLIELPEPGMAIRYTRDFPCEIVMEERGPRLRLITFKTNKTIHFLLNCVISFCIVQAIRDENLYIPMEDGPVKKYIDAINAIDAGYYFRHSLQLRCIRSPKIYEKFREDLERGQYNIKHGGSQEHRFADLSDLLKDHPNKYLHDVGCGELYYTRRLNKMYTHVWAWEIDEETRGQNKWFIENRIEEGRVTSMGGFDPSLAESLPESDVLMTEVLEHMPKDVAKTMLENTLKNGADRVIISVPNRSFNKFYGMQEGEIRHDDHHWEPNEVEFEHFINSAVGDLNYFVELFGVGDAVHDLNYSHADLFGSTFASIGAIIKKANQ